jgi:hypothetical protein
MSQQKALEALDASIKGLRVSRKTLEKVIAEKRFLQKNRDRELREKARITRKLANVRVRKAQARAAQVVVAAPTAAEIRSVVQTIREVERMALADAMRRAGINLVIKLAADSSGLAKKIKL